MLAQYCNSRLSRISKCVFSKPAFWHQYTLDNHNFLIWKDIEMIFSLSERALNRDLLSNKISKCPKSTYTSFCCDGSHMALLLGVPDCKVKERETTTWETNKIGGTPVSRLNQCVTCVHPKRTWEWEMTSPRPHCSSNRSSDWSKSLLMTHSLTVLQFRERLSLTQPPRFSALCTHFRCNYARLLDEAA